MLPDLSELVIALSLGNFPRIAVQLNDSDLVLSSEIVDLLQKSLPGVNVSVLGDSVTQCCLDEISAEHYGSDCIVKLGHSCWFASQRIPAYFVTCNTTSISEIIRTSRSVRERNSSSRIVIFVESAEQMQQLQAEHGQFGDNFFICVTPAVSYPGSNKRVVNWLEFGPFSSIAIRSIGLRKQRITPDYPRVSGRLIFRAIGGKYELIIDSREVSSLVDDPDTVFIVTKEGTLYERLINRFGSREGRVLSCSSSLTSPDILRTNYTELLRRYRGVESVKNSAVIGIVAMHSAACKELFRVRDILSRFLRSAGKEVHMFSVSKLDGVKLGNFPEIDCFVIMNCPESGYFESADLQASCVSPFEALVAMDSLEWGDHIITDYDEMLSKMVMDPPPRTPRTPRSSTRPEKEQVSPAFLDVANPKKLEPARIEMGLRGIPSRYVSEPLGMNKEIIEFRDVFCPVCGTFFDLRQVGTEYKCRKCFTAKGCLQSSYDKASNRMMFTRSVAEFPAANAWLNKTLASKNLLLTKRDDTADEIGAQRALVSEECQKCKHPKMFFWTQQLRSADEGQTVFYECPNCGNRLSLNS